MKKKFDIPKMGDVLDDCLSCIFHNSNGTCGTQGVSYSVWQPMLANTNYATTDVITPEKPILNKKDKVTVNVYTIMHVQ